MINIQKKCDQWSHHAAVALSGMIPISTSATNVILPLLVLCWFLGGSIQEKSNFIFKHPLTKMILSFFGLYWVGSIYSVGPFADSVALISKMSKLLYIPFLLPLFREPYWRKAACLSFIAAMWIIGFFQLMLFYILAIHGFKTAGAKTQPRPLVR